MRKRVRERTRAASREARSQPAQPSPPPRPWEIAALAGVVLICLVPFAGRAFNIDDPLFLWMGKQIQAHPGDPYGFSVNWYGFEEPIAQVSKNPPLNSYWLALLGSRLGWHEVPLHLGSLVPALAAALGVYLLARELCRRPLLAALATVFTPVFLVSGTTVMADVLLLAFWIWAIFLWVRGVRRRSHVAMAASGLLVILAALTKYFGMFLIPLLAAYSVARERRLRWDLGYLLVPVLLLVGYQLATRAAYGHGLLLDAFTYASRYESPYGRWSIPKALMGVAYAGACMSVVLCFAWRLWSRTALALGLGLAAAVTVLVLSAGGIGSWSLPASTGWLLAIQLGLWAAVGAGVLALMIGDFARRRDAEAWLLLLWSGGTLAFSFFGNWTTNGRVLLPAAPAVAMLIVRRLDERGTPAGKAGLPVANLRAAALPLIAAAALSLAVAAADDELAGTARRAAQEICRGHAKPSRTIWFEGHWGFQYYMQDLGAKALVMNSTSLGPQDLLVIPRANTNVVWPPPTWARRVEGRDYPVNHWLATMSQPLGAGFYSDFAGPLPFVFGAAPPQPYEVYAVADSSSSR